jgi:hypothetical protein
LHSQDDPRGFTPHGESQKRAISWTQAPNPISIGGLHPWSFLQRKVGRRPMGRRLIQGLLHVILAALRRLGIRLVGYSSQTAFYSYCPDCGGQTLIRSTLTQRVYCPQCR